MLAPPATHIASAVLAHLWSSPATPTTPSTPATISETPPTPEIPTSTTGGSSAIIPTPCCHSTSQLVGMLLGEGSTHVKKTRPDHEGADRQANEHGQNSGES